MEAPRPQDERIEATFCFVDLAGFTAMTEAHGDEDAADLAERFAALARAALGPKDRLVKTIGDAVLIVAHDPQSALGFLRRLFVAAEEAQRFPALRGGLNHGTAVYRNDDVYGAAVNLAARICAQARSGQVLCTASVASVAQSAGVGVIELGPVTMKNLREPVRLFALAAEERAKDSATDPVCRVRVERETAPGRLRHEAVDYYFCSLACAGVFAQDPHRFTRKPR